MLPQSPGDQNKVTCPPEIKCWQEKWAACRLEETVFQQSFSMASEAPRARIFSHLACPRPLVQTPEPKTKTWHHWLPPRSSAMSGTGLNCQLSRAFAWCWWHWFEKCVCGGTSGDRACSLPQISKHGLPTAGFRLCSVADTSGSRAQSLVIALGQGSCGTLRTAEVLRYGRLWERKESWETLLPTVLCPSEQMGLFPSVWLEML